MLNNILILIQFNYFCQISFYNWYFENFKIYYYINNCLTCDTIFYYFLWFKYTIINFLFYLMPNLGIFNNLNSFNYYIYIYILYNNSFIYSIKFLISILMLIFIRAGIPRYRYDFLTKLGWIKFFVYTLFFFIFNYIIFIII